MAPPPTPEQLHQLMLFLQKQSVPVDGDDSNRVSSLLKDGNLLMSLDESVTTLHEIFLRGLSASEGRPCLGWRPAPYLPYIWITYQKVLDRAQHFGSGLLAKKLEPNPTQLLGLYAHNRVEWKIAEQTCNGYSMVLVPLFATFSCDEVVDIINKCLLKVIVVDSVQRAKTLLKECQMQTISLDYIIVMDKFKDGDFDNLIEETGVPVHSFEAIEEIGRNAPVPFVPPQPSFVSTIAFTSGNSGPPKGVTLTHANIIAAHGGCIAFSQAIGEFLNKDDVYISYMPLPHMFERIISTAIYYAGASTGLFQGNFKLLMSDIALLQPTIMSVVPRIINRIYSMAWNIANESWVSSFFMKRVIKSKMKQLRVGTGSSATLFDKFAFKKTADLFGKKLKVCICAASHIDVEIINFVRMATGISLLLAYGQTETGSSVALTIVGDSLTGSVGAPTFCNYIKLINVPEMKFFKENGVGEICVKGANVSKGYYKDPDETAKSMDKDGWFHTGDIGRWLPNGSLRIVGQKHQMFQLANGEFIEPEITEGVFLRCLLIYQVFIYGATGMNGVVAIVIPHTTQFALWCEKKGLGGTNLMESKNVKTEFLHYLIEFGKENGVGPQELPKKLHLTNQPFSIENDMLLPTLRNKRKTIVKSYEKELKKMCESFV